MTLDAGLIRQAGRRRARALRDADRALDDVVVEILRERRRGARPNLAEVARLADVTRRTLYARLRVAEENAKAARKDQPR